MKLLIFTKVHIKNIFAAITIIISIMGLIAYQPGYALFGSISSSYIPMAHSTAILFIVFGASIILFKTIIHSKVIFVLSLIIISLLTVFAILEVPGHFYGIDLNFEDVVFPAFGKLGNIPIARMSPSTGFFFLLIGISLIINLIQNIYFENKKYLSHIAGILILITLLSSITVSLSYMYKTPLLYGNNTDSIIPMALTTALGFLFLSFSFIFSLSSDIFPVNYFIGDSTKNRLIRAFLPLCAFAVILGDIINDAFANILGIHDAITVTIVIVIIALVTSVIIYRVSKTLGGRIDFYKNKLTLSEEQFRAIFEQAAIGVSLIETKTGKFIKINDKYCDIIGYSTEEMTKSTFMDITHPDDIQADLDNMKKLIDGEIRSFTMQKRYFKKDGSIVWVNLTVSPTWNIGEKPNYHIAVVEDITERKWMGERLNISEKKSRAYLEHSPACTKIVDLDFNLQYMSDAGVKGLKIEDITELYGKPYPFDFFDKSFRSIMFENLKKAKETGKIITQEAPVVDTDGSELWFHSTIVPVNDNDGQIEYIMVVSIDTTERKNAEKELANNKRYLEESLQVLNTQHIELQTQNKELTNSKMELEESRMKYFDLYDLAPCGYITIDGNGIIRNTNLTSTTIFGVDKICLINMGISSFIAEDYLTDLNKFRSKCLKSSRSQTCELQLKNSDSVSWIKMVGRVLKNKIENNTSVLLSITDITEAKKAEKQFIQSEKMAAINTLAGGIAHDFNNILMGILGNISLAKLKIPQYHPGFKYLDDSELSMDRAIHLTRQLLTLAKGDVQHKENVTLDKLVEGISTFDLTGSNVKLVFKKPDDLWSVKVDKGQMEQVFSNLTINARQAMPDGGTLYITLENADIKGNVLPDLNQGKYIKCTVQDEGSGIDQKHFDQIFKPFFTTKKTGTGLGLATAYSIIKKHGGSISINSKLLAGTTFTLYIPVFGIQIAPKNNIPDFVEYSQEQQSARILVLDDEEMICSLLKDTLEIYGFTASTALDGEKAIEMYKLSLGERDPFDVVIMDLTIPGGMGGIDAIKELLKIDPKVKCIVSSGYTKNSVMANYSEYGFKDIITKPYTSKKLLQVLNKVLKE